jgi:DNA-binding response OmpR family regulator
MESRSIPFREYILCQKQEVLMNKPTLLYAEDDKDTRDSFLLILHEYFDTIYIAKNGEEALTLYSEKKPDILLLDITMPLLNGLDLVKTIRKEDQSTPIIILSAHSDTENLLCAVGLKLEAYLLKPIDLSLFDRTIKKIIRQVEVKDIIYLGKELHWDSSRSSLIYKGKQIKITKKEKLLLELLSMNLGKYVSHDELILHIWCDEIPDHSHDNKLIQLIYRFNKKIMKQLSISSHLVENSYTLGYRLTCE